MSSTLTSVGTVISVVAPLIFIATAIVTVSDLRKNHLRDKEKLKKVQDSQASKNLSNIPESMKHEVDLGV